jgi:hypothetical protein
MWVAFANIAQKNSFKLARRRADDLQNFGGRSLLLQSLIALAHKKHQLVLRIVSGYG